MYEVGDRVVVICAELHSVTEKHKAFYERFIGMHGKITKVWSEIPAGDDYTSLFSDTYATAGYSYPYEVKLDESDTQNFRDTEIRREDEI